MTAFPAAKPRKNDLAGRTVSALGGLSSDERKQVRGQKQ